MHVEAILSGVGILLLAAGIFLQFHVESWIAKARSKFRAAQGHIAGLRASVAEIDRDAAEAKAAGFAEQKVPGHDVTFEEVYEVLGDGARGAESGTSRQINALAADLDEIEAQAAPMGMAAMLLNIFGTLLQLPLLFT